MFLFCYRCVLQGFGSDCFCFTTWRRYHALAEKETRFAFCGDLLNEMRKRKARAEEAAPSSASQPMKAQEPVETLEQPKKKPANLEKESEHPAQKSKQPEKVQDASPDDEESSGQEDYDLENIGEATNFGTLEERET